MMAKADRVISPKCVSVRACNILAIIYYCTLLHWKCMQHCMRATQMDGIISFIYSQIPLTFFNTLA